MPVEEEISDLGNPLPSFLMVLELLPPSIVSQCKQTVQCDWESLSSQFPNHTSSATFSREQSESSRFSIEKMAGALNLMERLQSREKVHPSELDLYVLFDKTTPSRHFADCKYSNAN